MNDEYSHLINDNLHRIASTLEEILKLVKQDMERMQKLNEKEKE